MIEIPKLFMSARCGEDLMYKLFVEGLKNGVRGFDTAREYRTEGSVGRALKRALADTGVKREEVFVQTRITNEDIQLGNIREEVYKSLKNMGLDYLDCFMFHWPTPGVYIEQWQKLQDIYKHDGVLKSIGMCNCRIRHLKSMEEANVEILPQVIQVEVTPFWQVKDLKEYCDPKGISIEAFSPLCKMIEPIRKNETLNEIAKVHGVSIPQVILRWNLQRCIAPISMTSKVERVKSNYDIMGFELSAGEMECISALDCGYKLHLESASCCGF